MRPRCPLPRFVQPEKRATVYVVQFFARTLRGIRGLSTISSSSSSSSSSTFSNKRGAAVVAADVPYAGARSRVRSVLNGDSNGI